MKIKDIVCVKHLEDAAGAIIDGDEVAWSFGRFILEKNLVKEYLDYIRQNGDTFEEELMGEEFYYS